jgi:hypothetical protein
MGRIADTYLHENLDTKETVAALEDVVVTYPALAAGEPETHREEILSAVADARAVLTAYGENGELPELSTANALRAALKNPPDGADELRARIQQKVLGPADNKGGRIAFRYVAPLAVIVAVIFGTLYLRDRRRGGYRAERI